MLLMVAGREREVGVWVCGRHEARLHVAVRRAWRRRRRLAGLSRWVVIVELHASVRVVHGNPLGYVRYNRVLYVGLLVARELVGQPLGSRRAERV